MMRRVFLALVAVVTLGAVVGGFAGYSIIQRGLSTRVAPSRVEESIALAIRRLATPAAARDRVNPVKSSEAVINGALGHFADHCASCHANDGRGNTAMGRSFYPPAPDMRSARTQSLTDGEIFSIIENGIRLTGMPAWGTGTSEGEAESWALVHFIRTLPRITPEDIARMEALNPQSPAKIRAEDEARRFLEGGTSEPSAAPPAKPHHD